MLGNVCYSLFIRNVFLSHEKDLAMAWFQWFQKLTGWCKSVVILGLLWYCEMIGRSRKFKLKFWSILISREVIIFVLSRFTWSARPTCRTTCPLPPFRSTSGAPSASTTGHGLPGASHPQPATTTSSLTCCLRSLIEILQDLFRWASLRSSWTRILPARPKTSSLPTPPRGRAGSRRLPTGASTKRRRMPTRTLCRHFPAPRRLQRAARPSRTAASSQTRTTTTKETRRTMKTKSSATWTTTSCTSTYERTEFLTGRLSTLSRNLSSPLTRRHVLTTRPIAMSRSSS